MKKKTKPKKPAKPDPGSPGSPGTLRLGETHPASHSAYRYIKSLPPQTLMLYIESFASCAIEGNRLGEVCGETLRRLMSGEKISDRYLCALAFSIMEMESHYTEPT